MTMNQVGPLAGEGMSGDPMNTLNFLQQGLFLFFFMI